MKPIREGMKNFKMIITFSQYPPIAAYDDDGEEEVHEFIGNIAEQYLRKFASVLALIRHLDCGIRMVSFTLGTGKQK